MADFDPKLVPTPSIVVDLGRLRRNLSILDDVQHRTGAKILLALKGFAMWSVFPTIRRVLHGICASSPHEARLGAEELGREVHVYAPAYSQDDMRQLVTLADHIVFNSTRMWQIHRDTVDAAGRPISCGYRVNPEYSEVAMPIYNPCAPGSRLGILRKDLSADDFDGIDGLHFHTLCEQGAATLARTLPVVEEKVGEFFHRLRWINFGGGHHITRHDYDVDMLCDLIGEFRRRYPHLEVYLEPGEAIALHTGVLVSTVLDVVHNERDVAILDTSAAAHMPDVLEMPYRPDIPGAGKPGEKPHTFRLGGLTCLAGDVIGDYSFDRPLEPGDRIVLADMAHYTMVKNTTFNGVKLPAIVTFEPETGAVTVVRTFGYEDYRGRLS
ncbi:MAG: carboxynorspermidine decarboxylase [Phycisphaerae bacterium]